MKEIIPILNLAGLGGVAIFIYYTYKGLKERIKTLTEITKEQEKTLSVVRERADEIDEWRKQYKEIMGDFQDFGKKIDDRRNELVKELELANQQKNHELAEMKETQLKDLEEKNKSYKRIQELEKQLAVVGSEFEKNIKIFTTNSNKWDKHGIVSKYSELLNFYSNDIYCNHILDKPSAALIYIMLNYDRLFDSNPITKIDNCKE